MSSGYYHTDLGIRCYSCAVSDGYIPLNDEQLVPGVKVLDDDGRGYSLVVWEEGAVRRYAAGCRRYTFDQAVEHWAELQRERNLDGMARRKILLAVLAARPGVNITGVGGEQWCHWEEDADQPVDCDRCGERLIDIDIPCLLFSDDETVSTSLESSSELWRHGRLWSSVCGQDISGDWIAMSAEAAWTFGHWTAPDAPYRWFGWRLDATDDDPHRRSFGYWWWHVDAHTRERARYEHTLLDLIS